MSHDALIEEYLAGPDLLRRAVAGMTRDQLLARPIPGKWSTQQVVCHLADYGRFPGRTPRRSWQWFVRYSAPPTEGRVNKALIEAIREGLGLKRSQVELIDGETGRDKRFLIRGLTLTALQHRLASLLGEEGVTESEKLGKNRLRARH